MSALPVDLRQLDQRKADFVFSALTAPLSDGQRADLALSDLFARVREEIEASRERKPDLLMPGNDAVYAATELTLALRFSRGDGDRSEILQKAAALMALAARLALEGTPVFPGSVPYAERAGR